MTKIDELHDRLSQDFEGGYTITDDELDARWKAGVDLSGGVPQIELSKSAGRQLGTVKKFELRKTWAWDEQGDFDKVQDYAYSTESSRHVIQRRAAELGLEQPMGTITKVGVVFTVLGLLVAVAAGVVAFLSVR